jgi:asparagine synthase (glutamine-hydrolysing)
MPPSDPTPGEPIATLRGVVRWDGAGQVSPPPDAVTQPWVRWDEAQRTLTLSRGPFGEPPLYWQRRGREIHFASEPALLFDPGGTAPAVDRESLLRFLVGTTTAPASSYFEGIHRVPEGERVEIGEADSRCVATSSWEGAGEDLPGEGARAEERLLAALSRAVEERLPAQGRAAILLSGGLDSTAIALLASEHLRSRGRDLLAFTWTSEHGDGIDETALSRPFLAGLANGVEHPVAADDLWPLSRFPEAYADRSAPATSAYPDLLWATLAQASARGVTTLFNGLGGDPLAGWLEPRLSLLLRRRFATLARRGGAGLLRELRLASRRRALPPWLSAPARRLARELGLDAPLVPLSALRSRERFRRHWIFHPKNAETVERLDRLSRRSGVRIAAPWYDGRVARCILSLPDLALPEDAPGKALLRRALGGRVPAALLTKGKGNPSPSRLLLKGVLHEARPRIESWLASSRLAETGLVEAGAALRAYREDAGRGSISPGFWSLLMAEQWLRSLEKI